MTNVDVENNYVDMTGFNTFLYCSGAPAGSAGSVTPFERDPRA